MKNKFYAVLVGRKPGIYETWATCEDQVKGYAGAKYKSFKSLAEAQAYLAEGNTQLPASKPRPAVPPPLPSQQILNRPEEARAQASSGATERSGPSRAKQEEPSSSTPSRKRGFEPSAFDADELYFLEYDGASKGNPGPAGAGALLRDKAGNVVAEISEGVGRTTNNVAEYRGLIAGVREALSLGVRRLHCQGDSNLVCQQVLGKFKVNQPHLKLLLDEVKGLICQFDEFSIVHVDREYNSAADALANKGVGLPVGEQRNGGPVEEGSTAARTIVATPRRKNDVFEVKKKRRFWQNL